MAWTRTLPPVVVRSPTSAAHVAGATGCACCGAWRAKVIFLDDVLARVYWVDFPGRPDHPAVARRGRVQDRRLQPVRERRQAAEPVRPGAQEHDARHRQRSDFDAPFYAEALGLPEDRLIPTGIPRMDRFFDPVARDAALAKARELLPQIVGRPGVAARGDVPGREGGKTARYDFDQLDVDGLYALAAEQDAVVLFKHHPFITHRIDVPEAYRDRLVEATDVADRRQRPAVQRRPADHRLLVDRVRVLGPQPADGVLRVRPRRVHRGAATSTSRSTSSSQAHRPDVPRDAGRHPAGRLRAGQGRGVRGEALRPSRRPVDGPGDRPRLRR